MGRQYVDRPSPTPKRDRANEAGEILSTRRIPNDPVAVALEIAEARRTPRWCWKLRTGGTGRWTCCREHGLEVHLADPLAVAEALHVIRVTEGCPAAEPRPATPRSDEDWRRAPCCSMTKENSVPE